MVLVCLFILYLVRVIFCLDLFRSGSSDKSNRSNTKISKTKTSFKKTVE